MRIARLRKTFLSLAVLAAVVAAGCAPLSAPLPPMQELAPTGKLRVGIGVGTAPSAFWATRDKSTGKPRGVTVSLGTELANRLGVPLELVIYNNSGEVTTAGVRGEWDVAFMPVDEERMKVVDFGPPYFLFESTYLVPSASTVRNLAEVDRPGTRVVGIENTTTSRSAARSLKNTTVQMFKTIDELYAVMRSGNADAVALSREALENMATSFPGARVLPGNYWATSVAVAVPKNHAAALAYVSAFIEDAKASGIVRRALDDAGMKDATVAPAATINVIDTVKR